MSKWALSRILPSLRTRAPSPVQGVSLPRSGHHWIVECLTRFDPGFAYCERYKADERAPNCCDAVPCRGAVTLSKSHDFALADPITRGVRYLIQVRPILYTIISHYDFEIEEGRIADDAAGFRTFARQRAGYSEAFVAKWVLRPPPHSLVLHYDDLLADTEAELERLFRFIWPGKDFAAETFRQLAHSRRASGRRLESYRHYDRDLFEGLAEKLRAADAAIAAHRRAD